MSTGLKSGNKSLSQHILTDEIRFVCGKLIKSLIIVVLFIEQNTYMSQLNYFGW